MSDEDLPAMGSPIDTGVLKRFASTISQESLGLVNHAPESWAQPMQCLQNVLQKVSRDGGREIYGWVFLPRFSPQYGSYLIATHHAVWSAVGSTGGGDITPFHENPKHRPYSPRGGVLFLLDDAAKPKKIGHAMAPLASRFFPATDDPKLVAYIESLRSNEHAACQKLYEGALAAHLSSQRPH